MTEAAKVGDQIWSADLDLDGQVIYGPREDGMVQVEWEDDRASWEQPDVLTVRTPPRSKSWV